MSSFDTFLNIAIPVGVVLATLIFLYVKLVHSWFIPFMTKFFEWMQQKNEQRKERGPREINFD